MIIPALSLRLAIPVEEEVTAISPIPDGRLILLTSDGRSDFLDIQTGEIEKGPVAPSRIEELVFSPDGQVFALRTESEIRLWDVPEERTRFTLQIEEEVHRIAFSPQGTLLLVGGERSLAAYYTETGRRAFAFDLYGPADQFVMTPNERLIFQMTERDADLQIWDAHTGKRWGYFKFDPLTAIALSPDGYLLAAAENEMRLLEDEGYQAPFPTRLALWRVSVDPGQQKVILNAQEELELQPETELGFPLSLKALAFTPDGQYIVGLADWVGEGDMSARLYVWDAASGRMIGREVLPPRPWQMALVEEGPAVAVLIGSGPVSSEVRIYEINTGR